MAQVDTDGNHGLFLHVQLPYVYLRNLKMQLENWVCILRFIHLQCHSRLHDIQHKTFLDTCHVRKIVYCYSMTHRRRRNLDFNMKSQQSCQYLVWPPFKPIAARICPCIEFIRPFIWGIGMLSHSSCNARRSSACVGAGWRLRTPLSNTSYRCSIGERSGLNAGQGRTSTLFACRYSLQILTMWGRALSCWNVTLWRWMKGTTTGWRMVSQ